MVVLILHQQFKMSACILDCISESYCLKLCQIEGNRSDEPETNYTKQICVIRNRFHFECF